MIRNKSLILVLCCAVVVLVSGCGDSQKFNDLKAQNRIQQQRIEGLENELGLCNGQLQQKTQELEGLIGKGGVDMQAKDAMIAHVPMPTSRYFRFCNTVPDWRTSGFLA